MSFIVADWFELDALGWFVGGLVIVAVFLLLSATRGGGVAALSLTVVWASLAIAQIVEDDADDAWLTVALPFLLVGAVSWIGRGRRLTTVARSAPLVLPVTLTVLLIPLLTTEVWQAANDLGLREMVAATLLTVPPLLGLIGAQVRKDVPAALERAAQTADADADAAGRVLARLRALGSDDEKDLIAKRVAAELDSLYERVDGRIRARTAQGLRRSLERHASFRLVTTALGLGIAVTAYLYALAWTLVSTDVAAGWLGRRVPTRSIDVALDDIVLPVGPYITVSVMLGIVATAVLLAFVATEERYGADLTRTLVDEPVRHAVALALPYVALREIHDEVAANSPSPGR